MPLAVTLPQAAGQAYDNLVIHWDNQQLKLKITQFCASSNTIFDQQSEQSHPVSNWVAVLSALGENLPVSDVPIDQLTESAEIVYRLCWMASTLIGNGITTGQATSLLTAYNAFIGVP